MEIFKSSLIFIDYLAIFYFFLVNGIYIILNTYAFFSIRKNWIAREIEDFDKTFQSEFYKPVSIIIPAYNEEATIVDNVKSILALKYPEFEVVVVSDGSSDSTISQLKENFNLKKSSRSYDEEIITEELIEIYDSIDYPNLVVIDKKNGGKADALNAGINASQYPLVCNIDADSVIDDDALLKITEPFARDWKVVAAGGSIRIANDCKIRDGQVEEVNLSKKSIVKMQVVEYLRAFLFGRVGWAALESLLIISGAFGVFRKKHVIQAGGYSTNTVGEDMELVLKLNRKLKEKARDYRVLFFADPVCWTQAPEDLETLGNQRSRWQRGLGQSLLLNKELFFNKDYGLLGLLAYPFYFFVEFLGPIIETIGYISIFLTIVFLNGISEVVILFFITAILMGILLSTLSLFFEVMTFHKYKKLGEILNLFLFSVLESFGYKQLHTWWRLRGIFELIRKKETWGEQNRKTFNSEE
ncbi:MAG: glycosyltransferase family 2 protein [Bacillota bacterium]